MIGFLECLMGFIDTQGSLSQTDVYELLLRI
jgi:hypothetical protein